MNAFGKAAFNNKHVGQAQVPAYMDSMLNSEGQGGAMQNFLKLSGGGPDMNGSGLHGNAGLAAA